jgi:hypothetical protein
MGSRPPSTESNVSRKRPTCAATSDRKGVKPADIIAIDERPVSARLALAERLGEGRVTQAIAAGRRARRGLRSSCSARSTGSSRGRAVAFCAIVRTRTWPITGSAVKAERSGGFDAIGVDTVEGGVRDLRRPVRAVFEARPEPRARQPATLDQLAVPAWRANQFLGRMSRYFGVPCQRYDEMVIVVPTPLRAGKISLARFVGIHGAGFLDGGQRG